MVKVIGLGECTVSSDTGDSIKTYALASCVGLVVYNPTDKMLGMVHIVLPSKRDADGVNKKEGFFAEAAVPLLFGKIFGGYPKEDTAYRVSLFGGCASRKANDVFNVGERNVAQIEQMLKSQNIKYDKRNTGGLFSRTIEAFVRDGSVLVRTQKMLV